MALSKDRHLLSFAYRSRMGICLQGRNNTAYFFGNDSTQLDKYAWYEKNSEEKFHKTGEKLPNAWGLYDMLGNVMEWTIDHYEPNRYNTMAGRMIRWCIQPGSLPESIAWRWFCETAGQLRSAKRVASDPVWNRRDPQIPKSRWWITDAPSIGFRLVRPLQQPGAAEADLFLKTILINNF
jgi:formylglycine-generating enzyme required for sulfatase activity